MYSVVSTWTRCCSSTWRRRSTTTSRRRRRRPAQLHPVRTPLRDSRGAVGRWRPAAHARSSISVVRCRASCSIISPSWSRRWLEPVRRRPPSRRHSAEASTRHKTWRLASKAAAALRSWPTLPLWQPAAVNWLQPLRFRQTPVSNESNGVENVLVFSCFTSGLRTFWASIKSLECDGLRFLFLPSRSLWFSGAVDWSIEDCPVSKTCRSSPVCFHIGPWLHQG